MTATYDIGVLGSGPAALSIAAACSRRGASVALVAPEPESLWLPNYCLWADEVPPEMEGLAEHIWPDVCVATPLGTRKLNRPYVKLNTLELQTFLWNAFRSGTAHVIPRRASHLDHRVGETRIHVEDGSTHRARLVVDASGATTRFVRRVHRRAPAFQTAYGLMLRAPDHGFDPGQMTLMDFRPASTHATEPPSFLYALPLSGGRLFLEETSLARRPAVRLEVLRARLQVRLESLGLEHAERIGEELCSIPMGLGLPAHGQPLVPFGAAASMVHPASGYLISRILRKAEPVAKSILEGLDSGGADAAVASGNATLWPRSQRTVWELYGFGLEALVDMNATAITRFFDSFFRLPFEEWSGFLAGTLGPSELGVVMTRLFRSLPASVRWHLVRRGLSGGAAPLARSFLQSGLT
jgi:lycopene cyclase-like protein